MEHPEYCYSHDMENNCTIIKWGESGYYKTDYPEGQYTTEIIDEINARADITPMMRVAMECCSMVAQSDPDLDWEKHYAMCMRIDDEEEYCPSATRGDYSPSNPWDAPGMSMSDFI